MGTFRRSRRHFGGTAAAVLASLLVGAGPAEPRPARDKVRVPVRDGDTLADFVRRTWPEGASGTVLAARGGELV